MSSVIATGVFGFATTILFLFCTPDLDTLFALNAPQPFVQIYAMALGKPGSIFMTIIAVLGLILVSFFSQRCLTTLIKTSYRFTEYQCRYRRSIETHLRRRTRWGTPHVVLDWSS